MNRTSPDTILVSRGPGETRYALLAGGDVVEIAHRRDAEVQAGAVYLGRMGAQVPGISAGFVEIGDALPGVLVLKGRSPPQGAGVPVVVIVPRRTDKGAELKLADVTVPESAQAPILLQAAPEPVSAWWDCYRDGIVRIVCAPPREAARLKTQLPDAPVEEHRDAGDIFAEVEAAIDAALDPVVRLPSGGSLVIEPTAAVVAIDVNSGAGDPGAANTEALPAVAEELRRRNIAGHIVVDLIGSKRRADFARDLANAVSPDPIPTHVAGVTPLGMLELTRRRVGLSLAETLCDADGGLSAASVAYKLLRDAVRVAHAQKKVTVTAAVAPEVAALLQGPLRAALDEARDAIRGEVSLHLRAYFPRTRFELGA